MGHKRITFLVFLLLFLGLYGFGVVDESDLREIFFEKNGSNVIKNDIQKIDVEYNLVENLNSDIEVLFCPSRNCYDVFRYSFLEAEESIYCAFYELDFVNLSNVLLDLSKRGIGIEIIVDDRYLDEEGLNVLSDSSVEIYSDKKRGTRYNNYMHNKFCIVDSKVVLTGSANPTERGFLMNDNNVVKFESEFLAKNYLGEFNTLKSGNFGYNKESSLRYNNLSLRYGKENYLVSSYFCPQDDCDLELLKLVDDARDEILFATFAITYDNLSELLVEKVDSGVEVRGLIESRNVNLKGSDYNYLNESFEFFLDSNKYNMHNKFFVIDERVVVTGSVNPSASGFNYNDENMLVIENEKIAKMYKGYFLNLI